MKIAYFISSHGFGHASRSVAIMEAMLERCPNLHLEIYSGTPEWFFRDAKLNNYRFHAGAVDVGLVQNSPMEHDLSRTVEVLQNYLDSFKKWVPALAEELKSQGCDRVICDISPLGILVAKAAGLPCVLFGNFTWDWIYHPYEKECPAFREINQQLRKIFAQADYRLQSDPYCGTFNGSIPMIPPVSRKTHETAEHLRRRIGVPEGYRMGMISMGGIPDNLRFAVGHEIPDELTLVLSGSFEKEERVGNMVLLPHHSSYYHPDLVYASDFIIGKTGYSTIAEVCNSGAAFGYVTREDFRESEVTAAFLRNRPNTLEINKKRFADFNLLPEINRLMSLGKIEPQKVNGSSIAADFILGI